MKRTNGFPMNPQNMIFPKRTLLRELEWRWKPLNNVPMQCLYTEG